MKFTQILLVSSLVFSFANAKDDFTAIFDGKTLDGWTQRNGTATYTVENGTIVGTTKKGSPNSFLCSNKLYDNFELIFEVKVHNNLNSGVQIRSQTKEGPKGRVNGPQVEIEGLGRILSHPPTRMTLENHRNSKI